MRQAVGTGTDITERKRVEEALRRAQEKYRSIFENAVDGIFQTSPDGSLLTANPALARMFGYASPEEMVEKVRDVGSQLYADPADRMEFTRLLRERGRVSGFEVKGCRRDGGLIWFSINARAVREHGGGVVTFEGTVEDITDRKLAEEALRASEERYRAVIEQSADGIYLLDVETRRVLKTNPSLRRMLGYTEKELQHMELYNIIAHDRESVDLNLRDIMENGHHSVGERKYRRKDGSLADVEVSVSVISYGGREAVCVVARDVTERKRVEEEVRQLNESLERRVRERTAQLEVAVYKRKRAEEEIRRSLDALLALYEANQILVASLDEDEIGRKLLEIMQRMTDVTAAAISLRGDARGLRRRYAIGLKDLQHHTGGAPETDAVRRRVLETGEPLVFTPCPVSGAAKLVGLCLPLKARQRVTGVVEAYGPQTLAEKGPVKILSTLAGQAAGALENARLYREVAERESRLQELVGKLIAAQEKEQRRVAYEVHDALAQTVVGAYNHLQAFANLYQPGPLPERKELDRTLALLQRSATEVRRVISDLRPTALDDFGLATALHLYLEELRAQGLKTVYRETLGDVRLPEAVETTLFRIAQESLTNVRKHSRSKEVGLRLGLLHRVVRLTVRDWGCGFQAASLAETDELGRRLGLSSMQERASILGGRLRIYSRCGSGTLIVAEIPLPELSEGESQSER